MNLTPFRVILGLNLIVVLGGLFIAYGGGVHDNNGKVGALLMPFAVSLIDFALGIACVVLMLVLRLANNEGAATADKYMQAFMASFGLVLIIAVPACFAGMAVR